jgi:hypothetical protein
MDQFTKEEQLQELAEIRSLMEKSSRFISLSGLSGVGAGVCALVGSAVAWWRLQQYRLPDGYGYDAAQKSYLMGELLLIAALTLAAALSIAGFFTWRKARRQGQGLWDQSSRQLLGNLFIPLVTGGVFCLILLKQGIVSMIAPTTLIFYGLALVNASKYTLNDIRYLGFCQIVLGLLNAYWISFGNGLLFWTVGFGLLHIVYGIYLHYKYE